MKKLLAAALSAILLLSGLSLCIALPASAEELPTPTFTYDFSGGSSDSFRDPNNNIDISFANGEGYATFIAEGADPYFRFADGQEPNVTTEKLAYAIIKYRTTADISKGEFFTNRHSGPQWGGDGTHVEWSYINDGKWHISLIDNTAAWGSTEGDSLYAFRLDPLATGAKKGDTIDIEFIHFFADKKSALAYAISVSPEDEFYLMPRPEHTAKFLVDGRVIYTVTFLEGDKKLSEIPVVPNRPGCDGAWEDFTLGNTDIEINAVYTPKVVETIPETLPAMPTETDPPETVPPLPTDTETDPVTETETLPESLAETSAETPTATEPETDAPEKKGCSATAVCTALLLLLPATGLLLRKKED